MRHLFTYGPVPVDAADQVPMQETDIGPIPAHWRVVKLGEVAHMKQGNVLPTKEFTASGFPVYGANGQIGWYSEFTHEESEVVVTCRGATCGTVNVTPPRAFITNNAMVVTPKDPRCLCKDFLAYALKQSDLSSTRTGTGQPQITKATLSLHPIPHPPHPEQQEIARILQTVDRKLETEEARKQALEALFKTLLHDLMTARRRLPREFVARFEGDSPASQREHQEGTP
jgi:type I restriction enzyme S subunit